MVEAAAELVPPSKLAGMDMLTVTIGDEELREAPLVVLSESVVFFSKSVIE